MNPRGAGVSIRLCDQPVDVTPGTSPIRRVYRAEAAAADQLIEALYELIIGGSDFRQESACVSKPPE